MNKKKKMQKFLITQKDSLNTVSEKLDNNWHSNVLESIKRFFGDDSEQYKVFKRYKNLFVFSKAKNTIGLESKIEGERKILINFFDETINFLNYNSPNKNRIIRKSIIKFAAVSAAFTFGWAACFLFKFDYEKQLLYKENEVLKHQIDSFKNSILNENDTLIYKSIK